MNLSRTKKILLVIAISSVLIFAPSVAHAWTPFTIAGITATAILNLVNDLLDLVRKLLASGITVLGGGLQWVIDLNNNASDGGDPVYTVWKMFRDVVSMGYIVLLILIAFGTVFDAFNLPFISAYSVYSRGVIPGFLISIILLNYSFAIGRAVTLVGNQVTSVVIKILPEDVGSAVAGQLNIAKTALDGSELEPATLPSFIPTEGLTAYQKVRLSKLTLEFQSVYSACVLKKQLPTPDACLKKAFSELAKKEQEMTANRENVSLNPIKNAFTILQSVTGRPWSRLASLAAVPSDSSGANEDTSTALLKIVGTAYKIFLLMALILSLLVVIIFMGVRIPFIWILLAISPLAWASHAWPGSSKLGQWWKEFLGWQIFAPAYLLVIFFGLFMINNMNGMVASLADVDGNVPLISGFLAITLGYFLIGLIFIGGAGAVIAATRGLGGMAGSWADRITGALGVGGKAGAFGAVYRGTGLEAQVQGVKERVAQEGRDITAEARGRYPALFGSREEAVAAAKQRFRVRGAEDEVAKLQAQRIAEQEKILKARKLDDAGLRAMLTSPNRDAKLAAGEILLERGKLTTSEKQQILDDYGKISPVAKEEFQKRLTEQLMKEARKTAYTTVTELREAAEKAGKPEDRRRFLEAAMQGEAGQRLRISDTEMRALADIMKDKDGNPDVESQRAFLEAATKSGRNKVAAIETMAHLGLIVDRNGVVVQADDALAERAESFSADDLLDADAYYAIAGRAMPDGVRKAYEKAAATPAKYASMAAHANPADPAQLRRLQEAHGEAQVRAITGEQKAADARKLRRALGEAERQQRRAQERIEKLKEKRSELADPVEIALVDAALILAEDELEERKNLSEEIEERAIRVEKEAKELQK